MSNEIMVIKVHNDLKIQLIGLIKYLKNRVETV
jgi:hypothetical protein